MSVDGQPLHLTGKEYGILELLSLRKGTTLTKEMFLNHLYGGMDEPELKIIDVFICKLRKKLATATRGEHYIETVWGRGYVLREPQQAGRAGGRGVSQGKRCGATPAARPAGGACRRRQRPADRLSRGRRRPAAASLPPAGLPGDLPGAGLPLAGAVRWPRSARR